MPNSLFYWSMPQSTTQPKIPSMNTMIGRSLETQKNLTTLRFGLCRCSIFVATAVFLSLSTLTQAANFTWTAGGSDRSWDTVGNWNSTPTFSSANNFVFYSSSTRTDPTFIATNKTIGTLIYNSSADNDTGIRLTSSLTGSTARNLTFSGIQVASGAAGNHTIGVDGYGSLIIGNSVTTAVIEHNGTGNLTIAAPLAQASGASRSIQKTGSGTLVLTAANTYTGDTIVSSGRLDLTSTSSSLFVISDGNESNSILGSGTVNLNGLFRLDISGLTETTGIWNLVNVTSLNETFDPVTFGLAFVGGASFSNAGGGIYTSGGWTFDSTTGNLNLVPEPSIFALAFIGVSALLIIKRRRA